MTESRFEGVRLEVLSKLQGDVRGVMATYEKGKRKEGVGGLDGVCWIVEEGLWWRFMTRSHTHMHPKTDKESLKLSEAIKGSVLQTAAVEASAATVGALVAAHAVDVTGANR